MATLKNWSEDEEFNWDPSLELGYGAIDDEHRIFHKLIVDFQEAVIHNAPKERLLHILEKIVKYAEFHFTSEEKIMADAQYPGLDGHASLHRALLAKVQDTFTQFQQDRIDPDQMYVFLLNWFAFHTSHEDKKLVEYLSD